jgi:hypothetical protein
MKNIFLLLFVTMIFFSCSAQKDIDYSLLPDPVKRFFPSVYPLHDSVAVLWTFEDSLFVARFSDSGYPVEVMFKENGYWANTYLYINFSFAPESIRQHIDEHYPDHQILKCSISNNALNERFYRINLRSPEDSLYEIKFTLDGKIAPK